MGGRPQISSEQKIAQAEAEIDMVSDMYSRYVILPGYRSGSGICLGRTGCTCCTIEHLSHFLATWTRAVVLCWMPSLIWDARYICEWLADARLI
jgi:hypothetical protein